jgi:hypothetical protein
MSTVDLNNYYSSGYFLIRADHPDGWELLSTGQLVSLSTCVCPRLELSWGWNPGDRESALEFGIPADRLDEFVAWCQHDYETEMDLWSMFHSKESARRFIKRFLPDIQNLYLIEVGLPRELEEKNWREPSEEEVYGVEKRIEQHLSMETDGEVLGFEVVSFEYGNLGHSWLCSHLDIEMSQLFGIRPNQYGLLNTHDEAKKIYEWIAEDEMMGTRAEPVPYDFWLLVSYPLNEEEGENHE